MKTGEHGEKYSDDGIIFELRDEFNHKIEARVGPVFNGNNMAPMKALWIEYLDGEMAISEDTFEHFVAFVRRRFQEWKEFEK